MDNGASVEYLTPGDYYFICAVAGHCSAGMKIKVHTGFTIKWWPIRTPVIEGSREYTCTVDLQ